MSIKIVLLNGPSGTGKTTVGRAAAKLLGHDCLCFGFADDLKAAVHESLGLRGIPFDHYEKVKNDPHPDFFGLSPRKAYIGHSEVYMKPMYGHSIFSRLAERKIRSFSNLRGTSIVVMTDCGFEVEADYFSHKFSDSNVFVVRLHREGKTFEGDSREYIKMPRCPSIDLHNNGTFDEMVHKLHDTIMLHFFNVKPYYHAAQSAI